MAAEMLCLRTFAEIVRGHMNKQAVIKKLDDGRKFVQTGFQATKDATGVFVFYSLLLDSLSYAAKVDGVESIPDVSKQIATYLKSGQSEVPAKFIQIAQGKTAVADVSTCFSINLIPNVTKSSLNIVLDAVLGLVLADVSLGKTTHKNFKDWRAKKAPADFLAEAFVLSVRGGRNKVGFSSEISDDIAPLLRNIDDIQAKLNALPRLTPITPPDTPESYERNYIVALINAYDDAALGGVLPSEDLSQHPKYESDLKQRRIEYFAAETVRRGTKEHFRNNDKDNLFAVLMSETYNGVSDVHSMDFKHGFERLLKVMAHATTLHLENCILGRIPDWVGPSQKKGVCHILVNEGQIKGWVINDG